MRVHDTRQAEIFNLLSPEERDRYELSPLQKIELSWGES